MNVVMITTNDPAGTAIHFTQLLNRLTPHRCRLVTTESRYNFAYAKDLHVPRLATFDELEATLRSADLFHFHMTADEDTPLGPLRARDFLRGRDVLHHHHGEPAYRAAPRRFALRHQLLRRPALVSTPDLLRLHPEARWQPNGVPLERPEYAPRGRSRRQEIRIAHSPTRRNLKNTAAFQRAVRRVARRVAGVREELIEYTPHRRCLERKRLSDLSFDHMQGYYGVSSLESLAMGVPTLAGLDDWNREQIARFTGTATLPWVRVRNEDELTRGIEVLAGDACRRRALGRASRAFMERHWNDHRVVTRLTGHYDRIAAAGGRA